MTDNCNSLQSSGRFAGWLLLLTSALTVFGMANHPETFSGYAGMGQPLHGALIVTNILAFSAFAQFACSRGLTRFPVIFGLVCLAAASIANALAGAINGFVVPELLSSSAADKAALALAWELNQTLAHGAVWLTGSAFILWGADLAWAQNGRGRTAGMLGALVGLIPIAILASGLIEMKAGGAFIAYSVQSGFGLVAAWNLLRK